MLGISYYLDKDTFNISETKKEKLNQQLTKGTNEEMKSIYSYKDIENIAENSNI